MSRVKAGGINVMLTGSAATAFLGFGWCLSMIDGQPAEVISTWLWLWAGTASITLAISLLTFIIEITDYLEAAWTRNSRGRHARR